MALSIRSATSLVVVASLVSSSFARADEPVSEETRAMAKAHFKRGLNHQSAGEYSQAIAEYQAAYALVPLPDLLFNIAQCYRLAWQREQAVFYYRRYLELVPEGGASDDARGHIQTLEHQPEAQPKPPQPDADDPPPSGATTPPPVTVVDEPAANDTWRWIGLGAAGVGVVSLGVGVWQAFESADTEAEAEDFEGTTEELEALVDKGEAQESRAKIFTGVGVALVVAGGLTWYFSKPSGKKETQISFSPTLGGLSISGRF